MSEAVTPEFPDSPAQRLDALWEGGGRPDLAEFLAGLGPLPPGQLAELLLVDQRRRWQSGECLPGEDYLARFPDLAASDEHLLDVVYGEYRLRERRGEAPTVGEYVARFPRLAVLLTRQLELHRALQGTSLGTLQGTSPGPGPGRYRGQARGTRPPGPTGPPPV